jgi:hydrogenase-4 component B
MLLVLLTIIPIIGALFSCFSRNRTINVPFITSAIVFMMTTFGLKGVFMGEPITYRIPLSGPFVPTFRADPLSVIFVILAAFLWLVVSIYSPKYMKHEGKYKLFDICTLVTLAAVLGVFMAGDMLTLLLFFELMTLASYFWVVHQWNRNAIKAGNFYLFYSITGGLILALGIVLLGTVLGGLPAIGTGSIVYLDSKVSGWGIALLVVGFGIKAGMAPLHIWLPHAHSAAPTPGSALLSGLLIKVGAYGLIRVGEFAGWGMVLESGYGWFGLLLVVVGICTMLTGVLAALLQSNAKRLLAYHSVSQMGYVILGLGLGLYLGSDGGLGLMGSIYHIVNHAFLDAAAIALTAFRQSTTPILQRAENPCLTILLKPSNVSQAGIFQWNTPLLSPAQHTNTPAIKVTNMLSKSFEFQNEICASVSAAFFKPKYPAAGITATFNSNLGKRPIVTITSANKPIAHFILSALLLEILSLVSLPRNMR